MRNFVRQYLYMNEENKFALNTFVFSFVKFGDLFVASFCGPVVRFVGAGNARGVSFCGLYICKWETV